MIAIIKKIRIFKIRKEERWLTLGMFLVFAFFNALVIASHFRIYTIGANGGFYTIFYKHFQMSGYDCWSWITTSALRVHFETARHPLFLSVLYPFYLVNHWLIGMTGVNLAVFLIAGLVIFCAIYSSVFIFRVFREVLELSQLDSVILTLFLFSFAHVLIPAMVPDHFIISMSLLTMTLYVAGMKIKDGKLMSIWQSFILLFFTAGISLSNGIKTILADLFTNRQRFVDHKPVFLGILLPFILLAGIQSCQYHSVEIPQKTAIHKIEVAKMKKDSANIIRHQTERNQWLRAHDVMSSEKGPILGLMNFSAPRGETLIENFFGESIQLHQQHLMQDLSWNRPVFVEYDWVLNYIVEGLIVGLFVCGIFSGIRSKFMQMLLTWFVCDVTLHLIMGFGIGEVYIMTSGWIFIIPVAIAFIIKSLQDRPKTMLRGLLVVLTGYLWLYNGIQIANYLLHGMQ